jgi:hypothetical protein
LSTERTRTSVVLLVGPSLEDTIKPTLGIRLLSESKRILLATESADSAFAQAVLKEARASGLSMSLAGKNDVFKRRGESVLVAVTEIGPEWNAWTRPKLILGGWFRYLGFAAQMQTRLADPRLLQAAELTQRARPELCLVAGTMFGCSYVAVTNDPIAADLLGLSLSRDPSAAEGELIGPWEDAIVQRATELELGVRLPSDISLELAWIGNQDAPELIAIKEWIREVAGRFGVAEITETTG